MVDDRLRLPRHPVRKSRRLLAGTVLTATAMLAAALPAAATAGTSRVEVGDGLVHARGAALRIPVTFTCPEGWKANINLQVVQTVGEHLANAYGDESSPLSCTGQKQAKTVYLQASGGEGGGRAFRPGPASAIAYIYAFDARDQGLCTLGPCLGALMTYGAGDDRQSSAQDKETIQLRES